MSVSETPAPNAPGAAAPSPRRGTRASAVDMVRTLVVIIGFVAVIVLLVPRPNQVTQPDVDPVPAAAEARLGLGFEPAVPAGLPAGWAARTAEAQRGTDDVPTWFLQYRTPSGAYVAVRQARGTTPEWEARQVTDGRENGTITIAGRPWLVRDRSDRGIRSWVLREGDLTTIVTGTASRAELELLASSLPPAALTQPSPTRS